MARLAESSGKPKKAPVDTGGAATPWVGKVPTATTPTKTDPTTIVEPTDTETKDPNEGRVGWHLDTATGKWVVNVADTKDPNEGKAGWHLDPVSGKWVVNVTGSFSQTLDGVVYTDQNAYATALAAKQSANSAQAQINANLVATQLANQKQQQNWLTVGKSLLEQYGVGELWNDYSDLITKNGYDSQTAMLAMQSLPSWTNRFWGNKDRLAKGLPVLSPAEYLATEAQYKQVMITAGIDKLVYSNNKYLGDLMGMDVSPYETKQRLDAARVQLESTDTFVLDQLKTRFGLTTGDIILHMLDPKVASSVIASKVASAQVNAEAARQGFGLSVSEADQLESFGVTQDQARVGFSEVAQMGQLTEALPGNETGSVTKQELVGAEFKTDAKAVDALKKVKGKRVAEFQAGGDFAASQTGVSGLGSATRGT